VCNAHNHSESCTCGFGGSGRGEGAPRYNRSEPFTRNLWTVSTDRPFDSFVNPNAICPVCSAPVFFYQSSDGGRVFFDELGYPWLKHPCTDNVRRSKYPIAQQFVSGENSTRTMYGWETSGWRPFTIGVFTRLNKRITKIIGILEGYELIVYANARVFYRNESLDVASICIAQINRVRDGVLRVSMILSSGFAFTFTVYSSSIDARYGSVRLDKKYVFSRRVFDRKGIIKAKKEE